MAGMQEVTLHGVPCKCHRATSGAKEKDEDDNDESNDDALRISLRISLLMTKTKNATKK